MSKSATGTIQDESGHGVSGLIVVLDDLSVLFDQNLGSPQPTDADGRFTFSYSADLFAVPGASPARQLRLQIRIGRHVLKELKRNDVTGDVLAFGTIKVTAKSLGWLATSIVGKTAEDDTGEPRVTSGNAVQFLCDNVDAWGAVANLLSDAVTNKTDVDLMQLAIDVEPFQSAKAAAQQDPEVVLSFSPLMVTAGRKIAAGDQRIEQMLLAASGVGSNVRIQLSTIGSPALETGVDAASTIVVAGLTALLFVLTAGVVCLLLPAIAAAVVGMFGLRKLKNSVRALFGTGDLERVTTWFADAGATKVRVHPFQNHFLAWTHAKIIVNGSNQAILLGSPFHQSYFDSQAHDLDNPMRGGDAGKGPIHDMSVAVRGPALADLRAVFDLHWQVAAPSEPPEATLPTLPPLTTNDLRKTPDNKELLESLCSVQVVRTINTNTIPNMDDGEQGILEAYLRAIHFAEKFIYIENQYFTDDTIINAVIDVLKAKPKLQLILLLNTVPDLPLYPRWQRANLRRIAQAIATPGAPPSPPMTLLPRMGVFTTWSHAAPVGTEKPRLRNNYLHTKSAIIDNRWATIGSANLDGASLDASELEPFYKNRDSETNCVFFADGDASTATAKATTEATAEAIDQLRRRLWAEHLGLLPTSSEIQNLTDDPLALWRAQAEAKRQALNNTTTSKVPTQTHILEWPPDFHVSEPAVVHLGTAGVNSSLFDVIDEAPSFDFVKGQWKR